WITCRHYHENRKASVRFSMPGRRRLLEVSLGHPHAALPVLAVRRIRDRVVEAGTGVAIVRQRAAEGDVVGVAPRGVLHEEVRLGDCPVLRVHLLPEEMDV